MNTLFLLMMLEMNPLFSYADTLTQNPYYLQACQYQDGFVHMLQHLARWHAAKKLDTEDRSTLMEIDGEGVKQTFIEHQWELVGRGDT